MDFIFLTGKANAKPAKMSVVKFVIIAGFVCNADSLQDLIHNHQKIMNVYVILVIEVFK